MGMPVRPLLGDVQQRGQGWPARGFWLIDNEGGKQPVYFTLQKYYEQARVWVSDFLGRRHRLPSSMEFGQAAVGWLQ